jgi:hypothetical protein
MVLTQGSPPPLSLLHAYLSLQQFFSSPNIQIGFEHIQPGVKQAEHEADHSSSISIKVWNA